MSPSNRVFRNLTSLELFRGEKITEKKPSTNLHGMLAGKAPQTDSIKEENEEGDNSALTDGLRTTLMSKSSQGPNNIEFVTAVAAGKEVDFNASSQEKSDNTQAYQIAKAIAYPRHNGISDERETDVKLIRVVSNRRKHMLNNGQTSVPEEGPLLTEHTDYIES